MKTSVNKGHAASGAQAAMPMALGAQNAANKLGQTSGPLLGGALFVWQMKAPYLLTGALLVTVALVIGWRAMETQREARLAQ